MASALLALFLLSFVVGRYGVPLGQVVRILLSGVLSLEQTWTDNMAIAVLNVRLPRILLACLVGCGLSAAGTGYQTVFQNPMAAPDILGASSGACFGAALAILTGQSAVMITVFAFLTSLLSVALVYLVGNHTRGNRVVNLLLAGIMVGSLFSACTSYIKLVADPTNQLPQITYWLMGSLSGTRMGTVRFAAVCMAVGLVPLLLLRWRMNLLTLSPDEARAMGVHTDRLRLALVHGADSGGGVRVRHDWLGGTGDPAPEPPHRGQRLPQADAHGLPVRGGLPAAGGQHGALPDCHGDPHRHTDRLCGRAVLYLPDGERRRPVMTLTVKDLTYRYAKTAAPVLQGISFTAESGDFLSVLGANGAGKSTLFRCLLGGLTDYTGAIALDGRDVRTLSRRETAEHIAYIPQIHRPTFGYSVLDTTLMGLTRQLSPFRSPTPEMEKQAMDALEQMGVAQLAERNFATLSGGEQQLVLIARALCQRSDILVMDEPTSSLDYGNQLRVLERVRQLARQGYTVLLSTHDPQHALRFSQKVLALSGGQVAADGCTADVLTPELLRRLYGVETVVLDTPCGRVLLPGEGDFSHV